MTVKARETFAHSGNQMEDAGTQRPDDDPLVLAFPAHYEPASFTIGEETPAESSLTIGQETPRRRGRPPGSKNKPKGDADG